MAVASVIKTICSNDGSIDYDQLIDISSGMTDINVPLETVVGNRNYFNVVNCGESKRVIVKTSMRLCKSVNCNDCSDLHLCKFYLFGEYKDCRRYRCGYSHQLKSDHNTKVLQENLLQRLTKAELCQLLLVNDNTLLPRVCINYNKGSGEFGDCRDQDRCKRLHICERYIRGKCDESMDCTRSHDFYEPHPMKALQDRRVPNQLIGSMLSIYQNILALKDSSEVQATEDTMDNSATKTFKSPGGGTAPNEICLSFVKGYCKFQEKCRRVHFKMPYKWEVNTGQGWVDLPHNEGIERDYCDPAKTKSTGSEPVCFDSMMCGPHKVRRLSTASSVVQPTFVLTTKWAWYWEDESNKWIQYKSVREMQPMASICSMELEKHYQTNPTAPVHFTVTSHMNQQSYELSFTDMIQKNVLIGTRTQIRRRPVFASSNDVQRARISNKGPRSAPQNLIGVPGFWDRTLIPDTGYERVSLHCSDRDYQRVLEHFNKTMKGFTVIRIERVQNKELWGDFQMKREQMKIANMDKKYGNGERLLFHGIESRHVDAICRENFNRELRGANETAYGEGSYFAKCARYSHDYTGNSRERSMFACRVLVGNYTRGQSYFRCPPPKDRGNAFYDSCVNNVRDPSIYVVFQKQQIYPEFLLTYTAYEEPPARPATVSVQLSSQLELQKPSTQTEVTTDLPLNLPQASVSPSPGSTQVSPSLNSTLVQTSALNLPTQVSVPVSASDVVVPLTTASDSVGSTHPTHDPSMSPSQTSCTPTEPMLNPFLSSPSPKMSSGQLVPASALVGTSSSSSLSELDLGPLTPRQPESLTKTSSDSLQSASASSASASSASRPSTLLSPSSTGSSFSSELSYSYKSPPPSCQRASTHSTNTFPTPKSPPPRGKSKDQDCMLL